MSSRPGDCHGFGGLMRRAAMPPQSMRDRAPGRIREGRVRCMAVLEDSSQSGDSRARMDGLWPQSGLSAPILAGIVADCQGRVRCLCRNSGFLAGTK